MKDPGAEEIAKITGQKAKPPKMPTEYELKARFEAMCPTCKK